MITSDNFLGNNIFPTESPQSSFCHVNDHLWHIVSYGIHFLTPQRVSGRLPSKSIIFPFKSLMDSLGCHINNTPLTISSKLHPKEISIFHRIYDQTLFPSVEFFLFTIMSSLSHLNGRNPELDGFSIDYVHVTSQLIGNQVSSSSPLGTTPLPLCPVRHLWTTGLWV